MNVRKCKVMATENEIYLYLFWQLFWNMLHICHVVSCEAIFMPPKIFRISYP